VLPLESASSLVISYRKEKKKVFRFKKNIINQTDEKKKVKFKIRATFSVSAEFPPLATINKLMAVFWDAAENLTTS
jgi:hypothetical protein